jgi:hypothetical protein
MKTEVACSSETSVHFQRTSRRYVPEDGTLQEGIRPSVAYQLLVETLASGIVVTLMAQTGAAAAVAGSP